MSPDDLPPLLELDPARIYVMESDRILDPEETQSMAKIFARIGVKVIVLDPSIRMVRLVDVSIEHNP